ncbi:hypothetical protein A2X44_04665 [candidate division CPR3 bacterium GWF2_35_18]|uniref:Uncharacterized protein n=1 Tax=candidate division CPR3 bacterium GW2011_GWF2_35_18 TaxID=1618350 RepID=A0A0G0ER12_UNCC3|nr:MAG: hypothetical protein UR67_C0003G0015 [candidate division CPR3 bacterium GW2011_GWF2_35_18]KKP86201.1 MAG: hypothetical protein UR87_C0026G0003 [candidate division CPR3 bacterium GW2011_GWE2_35_7]OGB63627.1 MAG: hypothetical protein A2X44_04665 [candidate division CPR3 bacterium GWF2_35_18]OGB64178.1 MAG: hypothetical protein A2250_02580 [candidate division CPR3 bacterium RIFOXYA2_FULL_35_13]OGB76803.1 MAG: hypothetical protein A2476_04965 [candidate division CPR3 bacterium RIFOXYC2_FULL
MPKTLFGKLSVIFITAFFIFIVVFSFFAAFGQKGGEESFFDNLYLAIPILLAGVSGVTSFITGLICLIKNREDRGPLVAISTAIGFVVTFFMLGEILFPH